MKSRPKRRKPSVQISLVLILAAAGSLGLNSQSKSRMVVSPALPVPPARSTTGPVPPRGVDIVGHRPSKLRALEATVIPGVPAYLWRHGSGPAAVAMVLAYYDTHGFPALLPGDGAVQTDAVNLAVASVGHYNDYALPIDAAPTLLKDKSEPPAGDEHAGDSLADFLKTSWSSVENYYGWTWSIDVKPGFENYVKLAGSYSGLATCYYVYNIMFQTVRNEIESRRPMVFLIDTDGNGSADHFVAVLGVLTEAGTDYFGCYNTWDKSPHWYPFRPMKAGTTWGVHSAYLFFLSYGLFPPLGFKVERFENNFLLYKEYINRLSWTANPADESKILRYRIYRKVKGAANSTYQRLAEVASTATAYLDRGLKAADLFTYRITAIDAAGRESGFSTAGN